MDFPHHLLSLRTLLCGYNQQLMFTPEKLSLAKGTFVIFLPGSCGRQGYPSYPYNGPNYSLPPPFLLLECIWVHIPLLRPPGLWALCQPLLWAMQRCTVYGLAWEDVGQKWKPPHNPYSQALEITMTEGACYRDISSQ